MHIKRIVKSICSVRMKTRAELENFKVIDLVPDQNMFTFRFEALNAAVKQVNT